MSAEALPPAQKALRMNVDRTWFGTLAEIGGGQEVARWFFAVGGAAGTIAKSISAYDMTVSDGIYGKSARYVSRERLEQMLEHEYAVLHGSLDASRGATTTFFVFANTVATRSYARRVDGDGWLGITFQHRPGSETSQIVLHARLLDPETAQQQDALGILGVNLVHAAWSLRDGAGALVPHLGDQLSGDRLEVDFVDVSGPVFASADVRRLNLELVLGKLARAVAFDADGRPVEPSRVLYKRTAFVVREHFRPAHAGPRAMLGAATEQLAPERDGGRPIALAEISVADPAAPGGGDVDDLLARLDALAAAGLTTLVSDFAEAFRVAVYLRRYAMPGIVFVFGTHVFGQFFDEKPFAPLPGGVLEGLGRLLTRSVRIALYPEPDPLTGEPLSARTMRLPPEYTHLREHLFANGLVLELRVGDAHGRRNP